MKELIEEIKRLHPMLEKMSQEEITKENVTAYVQVLIQASSYVGQLKKFLDGK